jgi:hypothetical protein
MNQNYYCVGGPMNGSMVNDRGKQFIKSGCRYKKMINAYWYQAARSTAKGGKDASKQSSAQMAAVQNSTSGKSQDTIIEEKLTHHG